MDQNQPERKWKRGDVNPETGLVFRAYRKDVRGGIQWVTAEKAEQYREANRLLMLKTSRENRGALSERRKKHYRENRESELAKRKKWASENKGKVAKYHRERLKNDPMHAMRSNARIRLWQFFKTYKAKTRRSSMLDLMGCTWDELKSHMERQFIEGMSWENFGKWQSDHIIPLISATTKEELVKLLHYTNVQPLWAHENIAKADKLDWKREST